MSAQAAHLAAGLTELDFACEFGEFVRLTNDPTEGIENIAGLVAVPAGPGSGGRLKPEAETNGSDAYPMPADA
jgi:hypothetical protein